MREDIGKIGDYSHLVEGDSRSGGWWVGGSLPVLGDSLLGEDILSLAEEDSHLAVEKDSHPAAEEDNLRNPDLTEEDIQTLCDEY